MTNTMKLKNKKGFTLTELIVVIVIIGILAAVLIPSLTGYIEKANASAAEQKAQPIVEAHKTWLIESSAGTTNLTFPKYVVELKIIDTSEESKLESESGTDYKSGFKYTTGDFVVTYKTSDGSIKAVKKTS